MKPQGFRWVFTAACFGAAAVLLLAAVVWGESKTCRVSETMPAEDGGPDWSRWVEVPCSTPSSARVETRLGPVLNEVQSGSKAVEGSQVEGRWR